MAEIVVMVAGQDGLLFRVAAKWADVLSVVGFPIGVIGLGLTLWGVYRSASAAERAAKAAENTRISLLHFNAISSLAAAVALTEEIKRQHRANAWPQLPDLYSDLRKKLIQVSVGELTLSDSHKATIAHGLGQLAVMERRVEKALRKGADSPLPDKFNATASELLDSLNVLLAELQTQTRA